MPPIVPTDDQNTSPAAPVAPVQPMTPVESSPTSGTGALGFSTSESIGNPAPLSPAVLSPQSSEPAPPQNLFPLKNYEDVKIRSARATEFGKTPDQAARIFNAESKTGLPTAYIEQNLEESEKQADMQGFSAADFAKRSPKFASWVAQNPNNYALSKDDLENGKGLESSVNDYSLMQSAHDSLYKGFADFNAGLTKLPAFAYDLAAVPQNVASKIPGLEGLETRAPEDWYNNSVTKYFEEKSKISYDNNPDLQADILQMVANRQYEQAGRSIFANVVTNAPNAFALMLGAGAGMAAEGLAFAGAQTGAQAAASPENQSADPLTSTVNAVTKGGFEAAFEEMGTLKVLERWSHGLMNKVGRTSGIEVIKNFSKMMVSSLLQEGSEETVTNYAQDLTDYLTGVNPDALQGIHSRALEAGIIGGFSGTGMTAPTGFGMSVIHARANKQTELQMNFYKSLGDSAEASKVRERLPTKYREMVDHMTKDGPVENLYIPVDKFTELFQSYESGGLPGAVSDLEADKSFQEAQESGGLVKIKTSIWAEKMAGTDHFNAARGNITFNPQEFTENESKEAAKALAEDPTSFDASQFDGEKAVDGMTVQQQVQKMLEGTGMSPENARKNAVVYRFFDTLAKRSGKTAEQIFGEYNIHFSKADGVDLKSIGDRQVLNQSDQTDKAKALGFNVDQPLYHGTSANIEEFDPRKTSRKAMYGEGSYFSTNSDYANEFAPTKGGNVLKVFSNAVKPFNMMSADEEALSALYNATKKIGGKSVNKSMFQDNYNALTEANNYLTPKQITDTLKSVGYDSIVSPQDGLVNIFDSKNIRSVNAEFNPDNINSPKILDQIKRGRILFDSKGNFNIEFLKKADASTFLHETAHFFLEVMGDQASKEGASDGLKEDYAKILKYLQVESRDKIGVDQHEKFAESFEKYLMEGKAPSSELREAFDTFKAWFIGIYKSITAAYPGVKLSTDIRGVFDRMLATEEEIDRALHEIGATPMIPNTDGVLSKADAEKYVKLIDQERELAADQARAKSMHTLTREMTKIRSARETEIREEVTHEVENQPSQIILSMIRDGVAPGHETLPPGVKHLRLDRKVVNQLYSKDLVDKLPRGIFGKDAQHPNIVAGLLMGSRSTGADLITLLANTPDKKALIEQRVQEQMNQEFPDPILDGSIVQSAMEAVHNDFGAARRQFEIDVMMKNRPAAVKGMIRSITARKISIAQFRARAEIIIGTTSVRDIRPIVYQRGELKHAKEAVKLFLKGDFDGAIEAKQKEILNHELYRVAVKSQEEVQKAQDRFNKSFQKDEKLSKTRDMAYVNAARAVLSEFGIGRSEHDAEHYLSGIQKYNPDLHTQMKEFVDLATANAADHRDVSFNTFVDMANSFNQLWTMSKISHQITVDGKKLNRFTAQDEMATIISELSQNKGNGEEFARARNEQDERKMTYGSIKSALKRVEFWVDQMDNGRIGGPFRKYIWEPVSGGVIKYRLAKNEHMNKFMKLVQDHTKGFSEESIQAPELIGLPNDAGIPSAYLFQNKAELLGAMLHIGNESNLRKLLVGNKWGLLDEQNNLDSSSWDSFITRMQNEGILTKADYDFLQGCWDLMEQLKPNAQKAHYEVYGYHFAEITSNEFITPFGSYKGGYAPAAIDRLRTKDTKSQLKAIEEGTDANYFPAQINGFSKARVENYAAPLSMNLNLLPMHVDQVLRFTHITPRVKDVTKMLFDKSFRATLENFDRHVIDDFLVPWLDRTVKQSVVTPTKNRAVDRFFRNIRTKTGMATMFLNVTNTLQQYTGILVASVKVAPKHLRDSTFNFVKNNKDMADFAYEASDFMKTKINFQMSETQKEISKILDKPSNSEKVSEWFEKNAYALQGIAQNQVDLIVWHAAYSQAQEEGNNAKISVQLADSAVRTTQGTFAPEDVSRFETGSPMGRLFTMFSSYFNMLGNLLGSEFAKTMQQDLGMKKMAMRGLYIYAAGLMIPAVLSESIMQAMSGKGFDADDDGDYLDDFMALFFGSQVKTAAALAPVVGSAVMAGINRFNTQAWDDRISLSPVISMTEALVGVPYDINRDIEKGALSKNTVRDTLTLISLMSGLPVLPFSKPINYLQDIDSGRANPSGPLDLARGLITGKPGGKQ